MKQSLLLLALCTTLGAQAQHSISNPNLPQTETEYFVRRDFKDMSKQTSFFYDGRGRVRESIVNNVGSYDRFIYVYDEQDRLTHVDDYRGSDLNSLVYYTFDDYFSYDPFIPSLCTLTIGQQYVDQEWSIYQSKKIKITRDEQNQIVSIADYTPGDGEIPDIPISYVKTFTYKDGHLDSYTKQDYFFDPVTEEASLEVSERWTDIQWEDYTGQVTDMNECFKGANRVKSAHVFDNYTGSEYELSVVYGGEYAANFVATEEVPSASLRKVHTLSFTDANGSFVEEFRKYNTNGTEATLSFVERVTEQYNDHGHQTLFERALTADASNPETVSVRQGTKYDYTYDAELSDTMWVTRTKSIFNQSYVDGEEGYYEATELLERTDWDSLEALGIRNLNNNGELNLNGSKAYDLQGRQIRRAGHGLIIMDGRKVIK